MSNGLQWPSIGSQRGDRYRKLLPDGKSNRHYSWHKAGSSGIHSTLLADACSLLPGQVDDKWWIENPPYRIFSVA
jgi:hypothetical protein